MEVILYYLIIVNATSAAICVLDKIWAKKRSMLRIPEKTLLVWSLAGGALFMYITMILIRHKTLHKKFMIGLPFMIFFQGVALILFLHLIHLTS